MEALTAEMFGKCDACDARYPIHTIEDARALQGPCSKCGNSTAVMSEGDVEICALAMDLVKDLNAAHGPISDETPTAELGTMSLSLSTERGDLRMALHVPKGGK